MASSLRTRPQIQKCEPCLKGKFRRLYGGSWTKKNSPGHLHADIVGKIKPQSYHGHRYFMTVVDERTRYTHVTLLKKKSEASDELIQFMKWFERQTGEIFKSLHRDGRSEFFQAQRKFELIGIEVETSTAYTPALNGLVERTQGVLLSLARTCLSQSKLTMKYWGDAIIHVAAARNILNHSVTKKSPFVTLFHDPPTYAKHMHPFGCRVLFAPIEKNHNKFSSRLNDGINLGHVKGGTYKILSDRKCM